MSRPGEYFWRRFLYGLALVPFVAVVSYWRDGKLDQVTLPALGFFVLWEAGVVALARWRRVWPFHRR